MPRRKQQAPRRSAGNARGPRRGGAGPGGAGAGGRGSRPGCGAGVCVCVGVDSGAGGRGPRRLRGGPELGRGGRARPRAALAAGLPSPSGGPHLGRRVERRNFAALLRAVRSADGRERPGEAGAAALPVLSAASGGGVRQGKKLLLGGLSALQKSSKGGEAEPDT